MNLQYQLFHTSPRSICANRYLIAHQSTLQFHSSIGHEEHKTVDHGSLFLLVDGMAGLSNERLAAEMALQIFQSFYRLSPPTYDVDYIKEFVCGAHQDIRHIIGELNYPLMGASLLLIWQYENKVVWLSLGNPLLLHHSHSGCNVVNKIHSMTEFSRRGWLNNTTADNLAQAWLFGSKIPNKTQHIFLTEGEDYGILHVQPNDTILLFNDGFVKKNEDLPSFVSLENLQRVFSSSPTQDWTAIHLRVH